MDGWRDQTERKTLGVDVTRPPAFHPSPVEAVAKLAVGRSDWPSSTLADSLPIKYF